MDDVVLKIEKANLGRVDKNVSLSKYTTYRVGGVAKAFVYPKNVSSLITLLKILNMNNIKYKMVSEKEKIDIRRKKCYKNEFIILCTGELNKNKNQSTLIKAMADVVNVYPNTKLLLAGNGPTHDELESLVKSLNLEKNIELLGYRTDLEDYVNLCDLVVSASFREGLPLNIMEAMICGKPVIASDNRGHRELIHDKENGILIDLSKNKEFNNQIIYLIEHNDLQKKYIENSLKIIKPYDINNTKKQINAIYT